MIHDYKFNSSLNAHKRRRKINRRSLAIAATAMLGSILILRFVDLAEGHAEYDRESSAMLMDTLTANESSEVSQAIDPVISTLTLPALPSAEMPYNTKSLSESTAATPSIDAPTVATTPLQPLADTANASQHVVPVAAEISI